mgnify:CR=1 FL=1
MRTTIHVGIVLAILASIAITLSGEDAYDYDDCQPYCTVEVSRVIDGDTFKTYNGMTIRIAGYNAPELDTVAGIKARYCLKDLIDGKKIRIVLVGKDRYGRQLARVLSHAISC